MPHIMNTRFATQLSYYWNSLLLIFLVIIDILRFVGQSIDIEMGLFMITVLGFGIPGFVHLGKILCSASQKVDLRTRVAILTILRLDIPWFIETCQDGLPATPGPWGDFRTSIYIIAAATVIFSQSHLMVGVTCTCATMEALFAVNRDLPQEYAFTVVATLFVLAIMLLGYTPDRAYPRRMRPEN